MPSGPVLLPVAEETVDGPVAPKKSFLEAMKSEKSAGDPALPMAGDACDLGRNTKRDRVLLMSAWSYSLPKRDPDRPRGQDAHFISYSKQTIGVADGVGGVKWADSGVYARELMRNASDFVKNHPRKTVDPMRALHAAFVNSNSGGASTACIITLKDNSLHAVNLGDSGFRVIRRNKIVYKSPVQQQSFNCPFQFSAVGSRFMPRHADKMVVDVKPGDVVVAGTDGLFDNLFDAEIVEAVNSSKQEGKLPPVVPLVLAKIAREKSLRKDCVTPFSVAATKHGRTHPGGKYDDVTVIFGVIHY